MRRNIIAEAVGLPLRLGRALVLGISALKFRLSASVQPGARFAWGADVTNILGDRKAIRIGRNTVVAGQLLTFGHGGDIEIGEWCFVGPGSRIWSAASIRIGNRVLISHNVNVHDSDSHPRDAAERHAQYAAIVQNGPPARGRQYPGCGDRHRRRRVDRFQCHRAEGRHDRRRRDRRCRCRGD